MIYLVVFLLSTASPTPDDLQGWASGTYSFTKYSYSTIGACEESRRLMTTEIKATFLISKCATGSEPAAFHFYGTGKALPPATPKPPAVAPKPFDEKPLPPSAPAKPKWESAA